MVRPAEPMSLRRQWLRRLPFHAPLKALYHRLRTPRHAFQPYGYTEVDRHPALFGLCHALVGDGADRRLLSFGCSTGEEVFSLRRYFPAARITGLDVDKRRLRFARRHLARGGGDSGMSFVAGYDARAAEGLYDVILCLSVFRHGWLQGGPLDRCDAWIRFADFERVVTGLAHRVKPGGLLALFHGNFRFADTSVSADFDRVASWSGPDPDPTTPVYGPDNRLIAAAVAECALFRRRAV